MIGLSATTLNVFKDCPRCFWMHKNRKVERPRGIFPSLPKGIDRVMKRYVEDNCLNDIIYLGGSNAAPYPDRKKLQLLRKWQTFQAMELIKGVSVKAWGELDDLIEHEGGKVSPWDFKSKADAPGDACEYTQRYYQGQADLYDLLLNANGYETSGYAYFTYVWPESIEVTGGAHLMHFGHQTCRVEISRERARELLYKAATCLDGPCPQPSATCEYCTFIWNRQQAGKELVKA